PEDGAPGGTARKATSTRRRRRSRSRSGRGGAGGDAAVKETAEAAEAPATTEPSTEGQAEQQGSGTSTSARRRRRRRRRPAGSAQAEARDDASRRAATKEAAGSKAQATKETVEKSGEKVAATRAAPTRTSRAARRGATERRRRRSVIHAERRTDKRMLMTEHNGRLQIAVTEGRELMEHYVARTGAGSMVGNIYLGRVQNVLPGMEAAFVDIGRGRNGVLYAGEVSYDEDVESAGRRIESVLKPGQSVTVQVTKDPLRGKGARLTAQISLPGRYLVYVPDGGASGISRRLPDAERERLRRVLKKIRPSEAGVIVRTAAEGVSEEELAADLDRLKKAWESVRRKARRARPPKALYEEPDLSERVVRDVFSPAEFREIVIDSREVHDRVEAYLKDVAPDLLDRLKFHQGPLPLFEAEHVSEQIHKALERKVWLPSGGYLIIDRVEAMTVIDVNTGKHVGKQNLEQTVVETNLEAAREIARQLRLRDIGGIIVIDFIDMLLASNRAEVVRALQAELAHDKTRSQVFDITHLGLLEMTRKKVSAGLLEAFSETCPACEGRGILITHDV
ncbi:MAG TPA: Rne/Rng family ribonuclease, partial [Actinomycetota bacterium]|nr:Rne/Rng family ribonuclease [Actinomycetota bacterium]